MTFDHEGYEWHDATTQEDRARGRRPLVRGRRLDRAAEMADGIREIVARLSASNYQDQGIDADGLKVLADDLRALL